MQQFTADEVTSILANAKSKSGAAIFDQSTTLPFDFQIVTVVIPYGVALDPAKAIKIGFPFKTCYVLKSTHPALVVKFRPNTDASIQSALELSEKDVITFSSPLNQGFIHYDAQSVAPSSTVAQQVTLLFSVTAEFKSGQLSSVKGSIHTDLYQSSLMLNEVLAATTATNLSEPAPFLQVPTYIANGIDRQVLIQNNTNAVLFLGPSNAVDDGSGGGGVNKGFQLQSGDSFKWNNRTSLWGYSTGGGTINVIVEF